MNQSFHVVTFGVLLIAIDTTFVHATEVQNGDFECPASAPWLEANRHNGCPPTCINHAEILNEGSPHCSYLHMDTNPPDGGNIMWVVVSQDNIPSRPQAGYITVQFDVRCSGADQNPGNPTSDAWVYVQFGSFTAKRSIPASAGWVTYKLSVHTAGSPPPGRIEFHVFNGLEFTSGFPSKTYCELDEKADIILDVDNVCTFYSVCDETSEELVDDQPRACATIFQPQNDNLTIPGEGQECGSSCPSDECGCTDTNGDGTVNVTDLLAVINMWGACPACPSSCIGDTDCSGMVNVTDLNNVISAWGTNPCPPIAHCP